MVVLEKREILAQNAKIVGSGETTIVLAHGYGADQSIWEYVLPELTKRCRVVVFDWNFGAAVNRHGSRETSKQSIFEAFSEDLVSLMDSMGLKNVVFLGHSMSGMVGCIASIKRPDLFRRLILLGASPRYLNSEDYEGGFERPHVEALFTSIESNFQTWARAFVGLVVGQDHPSEAAKFCKSLLRMGPTDLREVLHSVAVPCTVVNGTRDVVVPTSVSSYIQTRIKSEAALELLDF
ncbi:unnamed protein product [Spirodela intermedia]|uniref:AB hydrolase-1 domain-containing protein n=1 Tax=Spirodela intermedia TaxID=51605 RepID=A0A7I8JNQ0_SPIIN|nr:unnamed protein product [Spirodela intermedia]CAA6671720.1 unnamed protein product [Spirodela intermedia]